MQTEEYKKLKSEIKNTSRAAVVETGEKAKQRKVRKPILVDPLRCIVPRDAVEGL
jgi:hypothetical protein